MSFPDDFARAYRRAIENDPLPEDLADRTLQALAQKKSEAEPSPRMAPLPLRRGSGGRWLAWGGLCATAAVALALVAPLALPALENLTGAASSDGGASSTAEAPAGGGATAGAGGAPVDETTGAENAGGTATDSGETGGDAPEAPPLLPGLTLRAYAADGSELEKPAWTKELADSWGVPYVEGEESPLALFYHGGASGSGADTVWPEGDNAVTMALFRPETFTVEGSNIQRVQIHTSQEELYLQTVDRHVTGGRRVDLWGLDPRTRGHRAGYKDCDALGSFEYPVIDSDGHQWLWQDAFRMKRYGTVIDLSKEDDERVGTRDLQFGILTMATTPVDYVGSWVADTNLNGSLARPEGGVDGVRLTVTVTFDDGTCETQVIDLHRRSVVVDGDSGEPAQPLRDYDDEAFENGEVRDDLIYGTIVSKTSEPFPYADEPANAYADTVMPPVPMEEPYTL